MSSTINFGIDLGTTNSLIAKNTSGSIEIFRNPAGMKETLPSVVGFRKERILIGDKAKEYLAKDPNNVFGGFKRKMGTDETFFVPNIDGTKSPVDLSSMILQELKNFIYSGEVPQSVVITIPASFNTIQSNATKEAGYLAGFKEVVLLQEPIAASLAFANKLQEKEVIGQRLVYDLGGGTFDVAIVKIDDNELKVIDHEGDNFLGGMDFDHIIVTKIIVAYLESQFGIDQLAQKMQSASGAYNKLYYKLLYKAEEAKIALSTNESVDIEFDFEDAQGEINEIILTIYRNQFEEIIKDKILYTITFIKDLLRRNNLNPTDIQEVVMVGGSTYIPLIRSLIQESLGIKVNCTVDPTTAVALGAAHYAGSKTMQLPNDKKVALKEDYRKEDLKVKMAYQKSTREKEEYFTALIENVKPGMTYRILRDDGGYDSGIKPLNDRISEMLLLLPNTVNIFKLKVYDAQQQLLGLTLPEISIVQGNFSIYGQPLPDDLCIEVDDVDNNNTKLEVIFEKNSILPLKKTITKSLSRTISKQSDEQLLINILEGSRYATPSSNLSIGQISINGKHLQTNLIKGSDLELTIEVSESRDITVTAYIGAIDLEFKEVFNPSVRCVNVLRLKEEIDFLIRVANKRIDYAIQKDLYEEAAVLQKTNDELRAVQRELALLTNDDTTDLKYQIDDKKRKIATLIDKNSGDEKLVELKEEYYKMKTHCQQLIAQVVVEAYKLKFERIVANETEWINDGSGRSFLKRKVDELGELSWEIRSRDLGQVTATYMYYALKSEDDYRDPEKFRMLKERGDQALHRRNIDEILAIIYQIYALYKHKDSEEPMKGTGLN